MARRTTESAVHRQYSGAIMRKALSSMVPTMNSPIESTLRKRLITTGSGNILEL